MIPCSAPYSIPYLVRNTQFLGQFPDTVSDHAVGEGGAEVAPRGGDVLDGAVVAVPLTLDVHPGIWRGSLHDRAVVRRRCVRCDAVVARGSPRWSWRDDGRWRSSAKYRRTVPGTGYVSLGKESSKGLNTESNNPQGASATALIEIAGGRHCRDEHTMLPRFRALLER